MFRAGSQQTVICRELTFTPSPLCILLSKMGRKHSKGLFCPEQFDESSMHLLFGALSPVT